MLIQAAGTLQHEPITAIAVLFGAGVLTSLTPCIYPMIPITAGIVTGAVGDAPKRGRAVLELLGEPRYPQRIDVFIVDARADLAALFGRETNGVAQYRTNVIGIVATPLVSRPNSAARSARASTMKTSMRCG